MSKYKPGYDELDDMFMVKSMQKKWRESWPGAAIDTSRWDTAIGSGMAVAVASGQLTITTGITASAVTTVTGKEMFTIPCRFMVSMMLSQRIANQTFYLDLVSCDPTTGSPDDVNIASWKLDGATATQGKFTVKNMSGTELESAASTITTTAGQAILEAELFADETWFHSRILDSANGRANSYVRHRDIPDPNRLYKFRIRAVNGATAPASTTTLTCLFVLVNDYAELTAEITAGRGNMAAGQGIAVSYLPAVSGTVTATPPTPTAHTLTSAATTNATSVKATAGTIFGLAVSNTSASARYLKLYNKASAPTVGTDVPVLTIPIPATSVVTLPLGTEGLRFGTGIAYAITGAIADADTTVIAAAEVKVMLAYV